MNVDHIRTALVVGMGRWASRSRPSARRTATSDRLNEMFAIALRLYLDDVASVEDIDRAVMTVLKLPRRSFGSLDQIGLDTVVHITENKGPGYRRSRTAGRARATQKGSSSTRVVWE